VLRGGFGVFYDLATAEAGNLLFAGIYPYTGLKAATGTFPLSPSAAAPPPIADPALGIGAFDPHLKLPYTCSGTSLSSRSWGGNRPSLLPILDQSEDG